MLPSIVALSRPLLSCLRWPAAAPVSAKPRILPSRAYASSSTPTTQCNGSADVTTATAAARHLHVVLRDDATHRFSIYKLPGVDEDAVTDSDEAPRHLPPAALHLGITLVGLTPHFEAVGGKIAIYGEAETISMQKNCCQFITLLYDTKTGTLDGGRALPDPDEAWLKDGDGYHAAAPVGDKLCVLEAEGNKPFYLYEDPSEPWYFLDEWAWEQGPSPLPLDATGRKISVKAHAVHPDGRTIFASSNFTFSLDTEDNRSARHGDWLLPFNGRAYYDEDLDAWVGIRLADGTEGGSIEGYPYLCACDVPKALARSGSRRGHPATRLPEPAWKMCKEELTFVDAPARARTPTFVHTGRGRFCLVEISDGAEFKNPTSDGVEHLLHVTMFHANHGKNGELEVTPCRPGRSYFVPNHSKGFCTAMWM